MSMGSKLLFLSLTVLSLSACNSSSGSGEKPKLKGTCIPDSSLEGIVGGDTVSQYGVDATRVVMLLSTSGDNIELCTAAAIAPDVLLTAAHCITSDAANTKAYTTASATCSSGFDRLRDAREVSAVVVNESYRELSRSNMQSVKSDVALVFLKEKLPNYYPTYKIADPARANEFGSLYLFGYGAVSMKKRSSGILRKTQVEHSDYKIDSGLKEVSIDQTLGHGVCSGDSGGPGLVMLDGELQILGVNSYVAGPRDSDYCQYEGNLALADYYTDWIDRKLQMYGRARKQ